MAVNQLKAGAVLSYVIIVANIIIGILYTPFVLRELGQNEWGLYSLATSIIAYLTILDLGFSNAIVRYTSAFRAQGRDREQSEMFGMFMRLYIAIGVVALGAGLVLAHYAEELFGGAMSVAELSKLRLILLLIAFNLAFTFPLSIFSSIITAYENFVFQKVVNLVRIVLNPVAIIVVLLCGYKSLALVAVTTFFNLASLLINWWYCARRLKIKIIYKRFNWPLLREVSIYSFWIFLGFIMDRIYWSSGQLILGIYKGTAVVAVYAVAIQLQQLYMMFSTAISGVFLPKVTAMVASGESDGQISDLFIRTGRIQYIVMAFILSGFILFGQPFVTLWAGENYYEAYLIALIIFVPLTVPLIQNLGISILQARNQLKFRSLTYLLIALMSLALSIALAPRYGALGCAVATAAALVAGQIVVMNIYYRRSVGLDIARFWREIGRMSITPALLVGVGLYFMPQIKIESVSEFLLYGVIFTALYIPLFWRFSLNDYERELLGAPIGRILSFVRRDRD